MSCYLGSRAVQFLLISIGLATALVACTRTPVRFQNVGYNKGLEGSENKMLLLNAVRASKRYPMYFSASDALTGKHNVNGRLGTTFPFKVGPHLSREAENTGFERNGKFFPYRGAGSHIELQSFNVNPSAAVDSGFTSHSMANLMTAKFMNAILSDIEVDRFKFYLEQGWPEELIFFMAVQEIGLGLTYLNQIEDRYRWICSISKGGKGDIYRYASTHHTMSQYTRPEGYGQICAKIQETRDIANEFYCRIDDRNTVARFFTEAQLKKQILGLESQDKEGKSKDEIAKIKVEEEIIFMKKLAKVKYIYGITEVYEKNSMGRDLKGYQIRYERFRNEPRDLCAYLKFSVFIRKLRLFKPRIDTPVDVAAAFTSKRRVKKYRTLRKNKKNIPPTVDINTQEITEIEEKGSASQEMVVYLEIPTEGIQPFKFAGNANEATSVGYLSLRSPRDMLYYLGSLISVQVRERNPYTPKILVGSQNLEVELFRIRTGLIGKIGGAVNVHHEGKAYAIPRPGKGDVDEHRSMQALTLVKQLINRKLERDALPQASTVIVSGG